MQLISRLLLLFLCSVMIRAESQCYVSQPDPYLLFSTKTSYFEADNEDVSVIAFPDCKPVSFWLMARHGARMPGKESIQQILQLAPSLRDQIVQKHENESKGQLCPEDVANLKNWSTDMTIRNASQLTESGRREHLVLGQRYRQRLPSIFGQPFNQTNFRLRYTSKSRTEGSARAFVQGAFPDQTVQFEPPQEHDRVLRFFSECERFEKEVDENEATDDEQEKFLDTRIFKDMMARLSTRLAVDIGHMKLFVMYDLCRFEAAIYPDLESVWCAVFDKEDLQIMEYFEDLGYWYNLGYHFPITTAMASPAIQDLVAAFDGKKGPNLKGTMYFSHSEALLPLLGLLGLYKDKELTFDMYQEMKQRRYQTSIIGPFSNNLGFVLFQCGPDSRKKVAAFHQERLIRLEKCGADLCDWDQFKIIYKSAIQSSFDRICSLNTSMRPMMDLLLLGVTLLFIHRFAWGPALDL